MDQRERDEGGIEDVGGFLVDEGCSPNGSRTGSIAMPQQRHGVGADVPKVGASGPGRAAALGSWVKQDSNGQA